MTFRLETEAAKQTVLASHVTCNFEWQAELSMINSALLNPVTLRFKARFHLRLTNWNREFESLSERCYLLVLSILFSENGDYVLISAKLFKKFAVFYDTRRFVAMLIRTSSCSLAWAKIFQTKPSQPISLISNFSCLRHYGASRKVAGSNPGELIGFFNWRNPSSRTMALGSTQPLTEMSTKNLPRG
jgi:hypothetical protein